MPEIKWCKVCKGRPHSKKKDWKLAVTTCPHCKTPLCEQHKRCACQAED